MLGEAVRDLMPANMRLRIAVKQQQGWSLATMNQVDARASGLNVRLGESLEHGCLPRRFFKWAHGAVDIKELVPSYDNCAGLVNYLVQCFCIAGNGSFYKLMCYYDTILYTPCILWKKLDRLLVVKILTGWGARRRFGAMF